VSAGLEALEVRIGLGSCGIANGAEPVWRALRQAAREAGREQLIKAVGCGGSCHREPLVEVIGGGGQRAVYTHVTAEVAPLILRRHLRPGRWGRRLGWTLRRLRDPEEPLPADGVRALGQRIVLENCGEIDPRSIEEYRQRGGYEQLERCLVSLGPEQVIEVVNAADLRGRGGAGFPTARKWELARQQEGPKCVICNGDEGDPGAFMDRLVLESDPHRVVEGLAIAALAVGAEEGFFYIRAEYPLAVRRIRQALEQARKAGFLGPDVRGSGVRLSLSVREGAGAFVCGEETALIASLEGRRGMPRLRPPYPVERGYRDRPTVVNNVETLANVPWILRHGASAFAELGSGRSNGTKVFALAGKVRLGGLVEVPMGITIRQIVEELGGGVAPGRRFKAVQLGGPSGGCLPARLADTAVDYEALAETGAIMGSGGLVVLDDRDCMVDIARYFLRFTCEESCGKCTFCRVGTRRMLEILDRLCEGEGRRGDIEALEELADRVRRTSLCGLGQTAPNPVLTGLRYFREEFDQHLHEHRCAAGKCAALVTYSINEACIGCTLCAQACPVDAIPFRPYERHVIEDELCVRCGACLDACEDDAVEVH
jgi:NADH:ubiquinone oxidoreductase subunit F (NADH-binding)/NAD-dependent dihydropyrimidine dehydrogenase PreA subunit/(2Fe-2S) ferredoxin